MKHEQAAAEIGKSLICWRTIEKSREGIKVLSNIKKNKKLRRRSPVSHVRN